MKKLILALCLLLMVSVGAAGEEMQTETAPTVAEIALTMRPESEEPTHLTVGNSTKVSGSFFHHAVWQQHQRHRRALHAPRLQPHRMDEPA